MRRPLPGKVVAVFLALLVIGAISCSSNPTDSGTPTIVLTPSAAAPGQRVLISGYTVPPSQFAGFTIQLGPSEAAVLNDGAGGLWFYAPLVFDSTVLWHVPPAGAVDASLRQNGVEVAAAIGGFTYLDLPRAPGTARRTLEDLIAIVDALKVMAQDFVSDSSVAHGVLVSALAATDSLIQEPEGISLLAALEALETDSVVIGIVDAIYAQSRIDEYLAAYLSLLQSPAPQPVRRMHTATAANLYFYVDDYDLATLMQIGSVVGNFGTNFLDGFSSDLGSLGSIGSLLGDVAKKVPYLQNAKTPIVQGGSTVIKGVKEILEKVETVVSIIEFVINRMVASVVPTDIDSIAIRIYPDSLQPGDITDSLVGTVYAANTPDTVTFGDVVGWTLTLIGEMAGDPKSKRDSLAATVNKWLGRFKTVMNKYASDYGIPWDQDAFTLFSTPDMYWEAPVVTPGLYRLASSDPARMDQHLQTLTWKAEPDAVGPVDLWITPSDDPADLNITVPATLGYTGGTLGDNFTPSNKEEVFIGDPLHIEADMPAFLRSGQSGSVTFRVGVTDGAGGYTWLPNTDLALSALFGSLAVATGKTDGNGEFTTTVTKNTVGSNGVEITVTATDTVGRKGTEVFTVPYLGDLLLELGFPNEPGYPHTIRDPAMFAVRAGHIVTGGQVDYLPNIAVSLVVNNGSASPSSGTTNNEGFLFSNVSFGSGQDSLMIYVSATGLDGISALDSAYALKEQFATVTIVVAAHSISKAYAVSNDTYCDSTLPPCNDILQKPAQTTFALDYAGGDNVTAFCGSNSVSGNTAVSAQTGSGGDSLLFSINVSTNSNMQTVAVNGGASGNIGSDSYYQFIVPPGGVNYTVTANITINTFGTAEIRLSEVAACWPQAGCFKRSVERFDQTGSYTASGYLSEGYYYFRSGSGAGYPVSACGGSESTTRSGSASGSIQFSTP